MLKIYDKLRRCWRQFRLCTMRDGWRKAEYIRRNKIFHHVGENCYYASTLLPAEPFLVCMHDNVVISAGVRLITHSVAHIVFNHMDETDDYLCRYGKIEIHNNVYIGAGAIINYGITINENCIIAAGAVVTHDVPAGMVVGGVPAKVIGSFDDVKKRNLAYSKSFGDVGNKRWVAELMNFAGGGVSFDYDMENEQ